MYFLNLSVSTLAFHVTITLSESAKCSATGVLDSVISITALCFLRNSTLSNSYVYSIVNGFQVLLLLPCGAAQDLLTHHYIPEDESSSAIIVLNMFVHSMVLKFMKRHDDAHCIFAISG
jgi:hypothetical protein